MRQKSPKSLLGLAALALILTAGTAAAQSPDPSQVYIKRVTYAGPGCPTGSVAHNIAPDAKAFTLLFDSFLAEVGPGVPAGKDKTSCRVIVDLRFPQGWSFALFKVDYRGYASLEPGASSTQTSTYYFQATPSVFTRFNKTFAGPYDNNFLVTHQVGVSNFVWSSCDHVRPFNIDTELRVSNAANPNASGMVTIDSMDGSLAQTYAISWMRCP